MARGARRLFASVAAHPRYRWGAAVAVLFALPILPALLWIIPLVLINYWPMVGGIALLCAFIALHMLSDSIEQARDQSCWDRLEQAQQMGRAECRQEAQANIIAADVYFATPLGEHGQNSWHVIRCHDREATPVRSDLDRTGHGSRPVEHGLRETVQAVADSDSRLAEAHED